RDFHVTGVQTCALPIFMILAGDDPVGLLRLLPEGEALGLRDLQVVPSRQGKGIGGWAVRQAQALAFQRGHPRLQLRVYADNPARDRKSVVQGKSIELLT